MAPVPASLVSIRRNDYVASVADIPQDFFPRISSPDFVPGFASPGSSSPAVPGSTCRSDTFYALPKLVD
ncbi:hypothetical protein E5D57_003801 [Metarhizium anisopliae]|nr:hypothetical protein E5D57_003801 [Metarhizium anisopliae]